MNEIYLHRDDLETLIQFLDAFGADTVLVKSDGSSGIGSTVIAKINSVDFHGMKVNVEKVISDEKDW